ncbi:hypothetical protein [Hymenobacter sp. CRA2]|uniref:immunity protein Imm33 domain-containing protein n=1 Tax=Hymenobacter sp. CRA2 TaxID=1955620 RepID=UPI00098F792B|nr:hypothetical protein [Hymenobacter sp. CRA2]OON65300.1 hypothetical protein B0919_24375 [Hymenobacter sp. CRA2]
MAGFESFVEAQQQVCAAFDVEWKPFGFDAIVGVSRNLGQVPPTHGLRLVSEQDGVEWFLWSGEYTDADDFFEPVHASHLIERAPKVIRYLALSSGFRFLIDDAGYEDVWFDEALLLP